jgi:hypothetical protein
MIGAVSLPQPYRALPRTENHAITDTSNVEAVIALLVAVVFCVFLLTHPLIPTALLEIAR